MKKLPFEVAEKLAMDQIYQILVHFIGGYAS